MLKGKNIRSPPMLIENFDIENCYYFGDKYLEIFEELGVLNEHIDREDLVRQVLGFQKFCRAGIKDNYLIGLIRNEKCAILYLRNTDKILLGVCCFEYKDDYIYIHGICSLAKGKNIGRVLIEKLKESFLILKTYENFTSIKLKSQSNSELKRWYESVGFSQEDGESEYKMIYTGIMSGGKYKPIQKRRRKTTKRRKL
jgi:hypothetical protein